MKQSTVNRTRWASLLRRTLAVASLSTLLLAIGAAPALAADLEALGKTLTPSTPTTPTTPTTATLDGQSLAQKFRAAYWRGRTCNSPACKAAQPSSIAHVVSFGLAAFGGIWISRRRSD